MSLSVAEWIMASERASGASQAWPDCDSSWADHRPARPPIASGRERMQCFPACWLVISRPMSRTRQVRRCVAGSRRRPCLTNSADARQQSGRAVRCQQLNPHAHRAGRHGSKQDKEIGDDAPLATDGLFARVHALAVVGTLLRNPTLCASTTHRRRAVLSFPASRQLPG